MGFRLFGSGLRAFGLGRGILGWRGFVLWVSGRSSFVLELFVGEGAVAGSGRRDGGETVQQ